MSKFFLLVVAFVVIYFLVTGLARKRRRHRERAGLSPGEQMVPCAHCRINLPRSEAIEDAGRFFCSEEHQRLAAR